MERLSLTACFAGNRLLFFVPFCRSGCEPAVSRPHGVPRLINAAGKPQAAQIK
jgi:hypothetical protein